MRRRLLVIPLALTCFAFVPAPSAAAAAQDPEGYFLVGTPAVEDPADSAYALALAKAVRSRLRYADDYVVVRTSVMCERLKLSDFSCDGLMSPVETERLAADWLEKALAQDVAGRLAWMRTASSCRSSAPRCAAETTARPPGCDATGTLVAILVR